MREKESKQRKMWVTNWWPNRLNLKIQRKG